MKALDNLGNIYNVKVNDNVVCISKNDIVSGAEYVDITLDGFTARAGDDGYFVIADANGKGSRLCKFNNKKDNERVYKQNLMPIFGVKKKDTCTLVIAEGYKYELHVAVGVKDGNYYLYPRFMLYGDAPYEDITLRIIELDGKCGYSEMAVAYRNYQLSNGICRPLKERAKTSEYLRYAIESPEIRIRMGWKPAPPKIMEQTVENEPEMKVACTFDRVCDIIDELKRQGVDKAHFCLVGWNKSGHDGRYPQLFPVEEKLGGEERLRHLIAYAKENGYQINCHTNSTDSYRIADTFSEDIVAKNKDGSLSICEDSWSGGRMYKMCPVKALEYAKKDLPKVSELGFEGLHYIDVMTVVPLRWCYDSNHPVNPSETLKCYEEIMKLCHELFGGFSSEGSFDFGAKYLDYSLYTSWPLVEDEMFDCEIPLWEIAYHGIILHNPTPDNVNYPIKSKKNGLEVIEHGGRPSFYYYSRFLEGSDIDDWLGVEDLICDTDEQLKFSVSKIKEAYERHKKLLHLQTEFIEKHEEVSDNVFEVTYSNGNVIRVDYNKESYEIF